MKKFLILFFLFSKAASASDYDVVSDLLWKMPKTSQICEIQAVLFGAQVQEYFSQIHNKNLSTANFLSKVMIDKLEKLSDENDPCFQLQFSNYLIQILRMKGFARNATPRLLMIKNFSDLLVLGKVEPLTKKTRALLAHNGDYPLWTKQEKGKYSLAGAYDCVTQKIYLDIRLRPFDMAATLVHELDHLFRDQNPLADLRSGPEAVYEDELLASLHGVFFQKELFLSDTWPPVKYDRPESDITFYRDHGPFEKIWDQMKKDYAKYGASFYVFSKTLEEEQHSYSVASSLKQLQKIIWQGYFTGNSEKLPIYQSEKETRSSLAYAVWGVEGLETSALIKNLHLSPSCTAFQSAIQKGHLKSYLGILAGAAKGGNSGVGTGNGGVGTGNSGVGTDESGLKLEISPAIKPCLRNQF